MGDNVSRRRSLFAGAAAVIGGSTLTSGMAAGFAAALPSDPDADLIALCTSAEALDDRSSALMDATDDMLPRDPRWSPAVDESARIFAECRQIMNRTATISAKTEDGLRAKAALALREMGVCDFDECPLILSVLTQLAARA